MGRFNIFGFSITFLTLILVINTIGLILLYNTPIEWFLGVSFFYYLICLLEEAYALDERNVK